jgi:hypothetical protein
MPRRQRSGSAAVLSLLLAIALLVPSWSRGVVPVADLGHPAPVAPAADSGGPSHAALLVPRLKLLSQVSRGSGAAPVQLPWAHLGATVRPGVDLPAAIAAAPRVVAAVALALLNPWWGRAPPRG